MSQTFTNITGANQLGGFPSISNANFDAIRSQWSGTSAPGSPVIGQPFYNTTTGYITIWNGTSWVDSINASASLLALSAEVVAARGTASSLNARLSIAMNPDGTLKDTLPVGDWWMDEPDTPSYVNSTSFSLPGDKTAVYVQNRPVYLNQTTDDYGYIVSSTYSDPSTTIAVEGAVVDTGITAVQYGQPVGNSPKLEITDGGTGAITTIGAKTNLNILYYNPLDYGSTVNTTTIQAAIDAAVVAGGGEVILPAGTFTITGEIVHNSATPITIKGVGRRQTVLQASGTFDSVFNIGASSIGLQVENIFFDSATTITPGVILDAGSVDAVFTNCKWSGSGGVDLCTSYAAGFIEWHNCHFIQGNASNAGLVLDSNNQVWRLINGRFSGIGNGLKILGTSADVEGGRVIGTHWVNTGEWAVDLGPSFDTVFESCSMDQQSVSGLIIDTDADRVTMTNSYIGAPSGNTTAKLIDIKADSGNHMTFIGNTFYGGAGAIQARATATSGEYLDGLQVIGNKFIGQDAFALILDSVIKAMIVGNVDKGSPSGGSWGTSATNSVNGSYTFDDNYWYTTSPASFSTAASYKWGKDYGIVMHNSGTVSATSTTSVSTAHGLSRTPTWCQGTPTINVGNWWNSVLNATNVGFTWITSGSPDFHWEAEV